MSRKNDMPAYAKLCDFRSENRKSETHGISSQNTA